MNSMPDVMKEAGGIDAVLQVQAYGIQNNGTFYTDSNGLRMIQRSCHRATPQIQPETHYGFNITENYYPVTSAISIHDNTTKK